MPRITHDFQVESVFYRLCTTCTNSFLLISVVCHRHAITCNETRVFLFLEKINSIDNLHSCGDAAHASRRIKKLHVQND